MKHQKNKSFLQTLKRLLRILVGLVIAVLMMFIVSVYRTSLEKQQVQLGNYAMLYGNQAENRLAVAKGSLAELVYNNSYLNLLRSSSEAEKQYAAIGLYQQMKTLMHTDMGADMMVAAESSNDTIVNCRHENVNFYEGKALNEFTINYAESGAQTAAWQAMKTEERGYMYRALLYSGRAVIVFVSLDSLAQVFPAGRIKDVRFLLCDDAGNILYLSGDQTVCEDYGNISEVPTQTLLLQKYELTGCNFSLYACQKKSEIFSQARGPMLLLFLIIVLLALFSLYFSKIIRAELLTPMRQMTDEMEYIKQGQYELRIETQSDSVEFQTLVQSFNKLIGEIVSLKIESYEKRLALMDAERKYINLQIRPHFFLNAMTTIVSLSRAGKNREIEAYIDALSQNIRYMFSSGLHTVPLADEIRHVENYFEMQELKYPGSVLYFVDMPENVSTWKIPQMLIHTLVENEYKYAVSMSTQLMILIKIGKEVRDGVEMLSIQVEDDGKGYPQDVIAQINNGNGHTLKDGTRVGLQSIRRLLEVMYDKQGLFTISNVQPHGVMNHVLIPAQPVNTREMDDKKQA